MSTFAVLASEDFESKQARSRAVTATIVRAQEMFDPYLSKAVSAEDKADRILLIEDDLKRVAYAVGKEYGYEDYRHLYTAARTVLAEDKTEDAEDEEEKDEWEKPWEKEAAGMAVDKCPECGLDGVYMHKGACPQCGAVVGPSAKDIRNTFEAPTQWGQQQEARPGGILPQESGAPIYSRTANQWIKKRGDKFVIIQKGTGKVLSTHDSEEQAQQSFEAMEAHKHGAAEPETGDSYQSERVDLPSNTDTGLGGPSPKIDKGSAGDVAHTSQKPIDVGSKRHEHELQNATDRADYNDKDFDPSSPVRERVDADKPLQPEFTKAPATDTWSGTDGQAKPVTSKYQVVSLA